MSLKSAHAVSVDAGKLSMKPYTFSGNQWLWALLSEESGTSSSDKLGVCLDTLGSLKT